MAITNFQTPPFDPRIRTTDQNLQQTMLPQHRTMSGQTLGGQFQGPPAGPTPLDQRQTFQARNTAPQQAAPQFGLQAAENALQGGFQGALNAGQQGTNQALGTLMFGNQVAQGQLNQGQQALGGNFNAQVVNVDPNTGQPLFQQAAQGVGRFVGAGANAQNLQAALSGAQGQSAFDQALIDNPLQNLLNERGQQALANQAAATGGLGSGQFKTELQQLGQAQAGQQLQQQIQNLGALSNQGLQAAGQQGQFLSQAGQQQGNLAAQNAQLGTNVNLQNAGNRLNAAQNQAQLFGQGAGISAGLAGQGAGFQQQGGINAANLFSGTGQQVSQGRTRAGEQIAGQVGASTSALTNLVNQQGGGLVDILGAGSANVSNLLRDFGTMSAQQQAQLASLLSGISTGSGAQLSNIAQNAGAANAQAALQQGANQQNLLGNLAGVFGQIQGGSNPFFTP